MNQEVKTYKRIYRWLCGKDLFLECGTSCALFCGHALGWQLTVAPSSESWSPLPWEGSPGPRIEHSCKCPSGIHSRWRHWPTLWLQRSLLPPLPKPWQQRVPDSSSVCGFRQRPRMSSVELEQLELRWLCPEHEPDHSLLGGTDSKYFH